MASDLMYRADTKAAWDAYASDMALTDDEGRPLGCYIDEIGPIVVTPAVIGPDGEIVTPAVMDDRWHVNVRVTQVSGPLPDPVPEGYVQQGHDLAVLAQGGAGVEWLDPSTVKSPVRIWAGGMSYWTPESETVN
jgi:hypothetical protein